MDQPVHPVQVDERAEVDDVGDLTLDDVAGVEPVEDRLAHLLALVLEHCASRENDVVARAIELDDLAAKLLAEELVEILDAPDIDERRGQEPADAEGRLILSKKRARFELAWKKIEAAAESGEPVVGKVIEVVKGGLILDLGVRGFLPASLVDIRRVQDLDEFLGRELRCKVIELNRSRNNVVLSRRAVL
ncbi:MAG TPA: S1 RNA-binding domain-containing protein, partial [Gaiellaceae bacterium]|nr:S1 RNA-binding domain-containing protein [Gaiellaceae bacterium]